MFNCYLHGWSHIEKPCPICHPLETYTSSGTSIRVATDAIDNRDHLIEQMRGQMRLPEDIKEIKQLRDALKVAIEALEFYASDESWSRNPDYYAQIEVIDESDREEIYIQGEERGWLAGNRAREALAKIKETEE